MLNRLTFYKPMGPNQPQIGQSWYQSTPLHPYIQNIKLVFDWSEVWGGLEWENLVLLPSERKIA